MLAWNLLSTHQDSETAVGYVPTVKISGGQRIDLFGLTKEQLPHIWKDLTDAGFVSGHAYGKAMRTVNTCVGSQWCRFGVQDSTKMGIELEELTWGSWTPHKFKPAVSGCPRNCAEATIKDFGVVAIESARRLLEDRPWRSGSGAAGAAGIIEAVCDAWANFVPTGQERL